MKGTKANARGSEARSYEAPFMGKPISERHRDAENPLAGDTDPTGLPYYVAAGGTAMPCYRRPMVKKGK